MTTRKTTLILITLDIQVRVAVLSIAFLIVSFHYQGAFFTIIWFVKFACFFKFPSNLNIDCDSQSYKKIFCKFVWLTIVDSFIRTLKLV
jgi:hypothetical protein